MRVRIGTNHMENVLRAPRGNDKTNIYARSSVFVVSHRIRIIELYHIHCLRLRVILTVVFISIRRLL